MKKITLNIFFMFLVWATSTSAEQMTLTTYYPTPYGAYENLQLYPRADLGAACTTAQIGQMYVSQGAGFLPFYCIDDGVGAGIWTSFDIIWQREDQGSNGADILLDLANPEQKKVGIGTSNPTFALTLDTDDHVANPPDGGILAIAQVGSGSYYFPPSGKPTLFFSGNKASLVAGNPLAPASGQIGDGAAAFGDSNTIKGSQSFITGTYNFAQNYNEIIFGADNNNDPFVSGAKGSITAGYGNYNDLETVDPTTGNILLGEDMYVNSKKTIALGFGAGAYDDNWGDGILPEDILSISVSNWHLGPSSSSGYRENNAMYIYGNPNVSVGIGNTAAQAMLHIMKEDAPKDASMRVRGTSNANISLKGPSIAYASSMRMYTGGGTLANRLAFGSYDEGGGSVGTNNEVYALIMKPTGELGISYTLNPTADIEIGGEATMRLSGNKPNIEFRHSGGANQKIEADDNRLNIKFDPLGTNVFSNKFSFSTAGNLGVGTTNPQYDLEVRGSEGQALLTGTDDLSITFNIEDSPPFVILSDPLNPGLQIIHNTEFTEDIVMFIKPDGNIGIGTSAPTSELDVNGDVYATGTITSPSSRALKEDFSEINTQEAFDVLGQLKAVKYNYISDKNKANHIGFIAEDVPEMLATPTRNGVSPMDVIGLLTKVVQDQQKRIEQQKKDIEDLKRRINSL